MITNSNEVVIESEFTPIQKEIIKILERKQYMTRGELVNELKIPRTTIYKNLIDLMASNLIKKGVKKPYVQGRQPVFFILVKSQENLQTE